VLLISLLLMPSRLQSVAQLALTLGADCTFYRSMIDMRGHQEGALCLMNGYLQSRADCKQCCVSSRRVTTRRQNSPARSAFRGEPHNLVARLSWKSVNEPLPEELFSVKSIEPDAGGIVVDARGKQPIVVEVLNPISNFGTTDASNHQGRWLLIWINIAVIGVLAALLLWRRYSRQSEHKNV
jgi:hypothetical protein